MNLDKLKSAIYGDVTIKAPEIFFKIFEMAIVIIIAAAVVKISKAVITQFFHRQKRFKYTINDKRADTLSTILSSVARYTIYFVTLITIINNVLKINITTILTAAGIGTVIIGVWSQSLVRDIIAGFFILIEDQFAVGDSITIDQMTGDVEEMELRITKLRQFNGDLLIIPNGEIKKVINHSRGNKTAIVDVHVSYKEDISKVLNILNKIVKDIEKDENFNVEEPKVLGVTDFGATDITIRLIATTLSNENFEIERKLRKKIKEEFDKEKILIPYTTPLVNQ